MEDAARQNLRSSLAWALGASLFERRIRVALDAVAFSTPFMAHQKVRFATGSMHFSVQISTVESVTRPRSNLSRKTQSLGMALVRKRKPNPNLENRRILNRRSSCGRRSADRTS